MPQNGKGWCFPPQSGEEQRPTNCFLQRYRLEGEALNIFLVGCSEDIIPNVFLGHQIVLAQAFSLVSISYKTFGVGQRMMEHLIQSKPE